MLKKFIESNANMDMMIKNVKFKYKYCNCFLKYTNFEDDLIDLIFAL